MRTQFFPKEIVAISKKNKGKLYLAVCFNYDDKNQYYVKNGKIALADSFNEYFAFSNNSRRASNMKGIFELIELKSTTEKLGKYSE